jgi:isoprenylcysteine carboxyl methyltransferase (ICMT) family protein YpbQ
MFPSVNLFVRANPLTLLAALVLALSWLGFGGILIIGKRGAAQKTTRRDAKSHLGFLLQCCGYAIIAAFHRNDFSALLGDSREKDIVLLALIVAITAVSEWFCYASARTLGKQWALVARVIQGHQLVQQGPYAVVRNPIYLAMLGNVVATALAFGTWLSLAGAIAVFAVGTEIRIRSEEKLLREAFGAEFEEYARRVPGLFPRLI